ncbi:MULTISPECIES: hypothetical protein [unclassified Pannonibacter]|uniref:hypothetical protein n=1 Tax=unclassified Pannonibacter TaxID=2627228 RepID=UPI001646DDE8|nr:MULTISPECIES: hypothetical protein [unclassified Pannonibacter]
MSEANTLTKPIQRVIDVQANNGFEALIFLMPFLGDGHRYTSHRHAENFVRYLFSRSQAHPTTALTARNHVSEYENGEAIFRGFNTLDGRLLEKFMETRFPASDAHRKLYDDGAYAAFALRLSSGVAYSNFIESDGSQYCNHDRDILDLLMSQGIGQQEIERRTIGFAKRGRVVDYETADLEAMKAVETCVQGLISQALRKQGDVILTVSHRDQMDTNPLYHVHRLLRL